jgi:hypothetical protein
MLRLSLMGFFTHPGGVFLAGEIWGLFAGEVEGLYCGRGMPRSYG